MTAFLNWIFAQASKVYDWFGNAYYTLKNAAANAWNWAVNKAQEAYNNAVNWAYNEVAKAKNYALGLVGLLQQTVINIRDSLNEDLSAFVDWVQWKFNTLSDYASGLIDNALSGAYSFINSIRDGLYLALSNASNWVLAQVNELFGWLSGLRDRLISIVTVLTQERLNSLIAFLSSGLNTLTLFFQNPVTFILDVIQEHVLGFLSYVIAWALGTTIYDLPSNKPWRK